MDPTIMELMGPGFLSQVPTLLGVQVNPKHTWEFPKIGDPNIVP